MSNLYARRDTEDMAEHYIRHIEAMTAEKLHEKSAIAAELAWRDVQIERLREVLAKTVSQIKAHEDHDEDHRFFYKCGWDFDVSDADAILATTAV